MKMARKQALGVTLAAELKKRQAKALRALWLGTIFARLKRIPDSTDPATFSASC